MLFNPMQMCGMHMTVHVTHTNLPTDWAGPAMPKSQQWTVEDLMMD